MPTLEEAIGIFEQLSKLCETNGIHDSQELYKQYAEWLRELKERRAEPEIVRCGECRWYGRADKRRFYRGMDCLQRRMSTIVPDKDFCSKAERAERRIDE